jgi:hypothetical protein
LDLSVSEADERFGRGDRLFHRSMSKWDAEGLRYATAARDQLWQLDFTVSDYEYLVKTLFGIALYKNPALVAKAKEDPVLALYELVLQPNHLKMEMKIPVAMPERDIYFYLK